MRKFIVKQDAEVDCGAACLGSIIKYYGGYVPLEVIKVDTLTNHYGTNFYLLKEAAIKYGLMARGKKSDTLKNIFLPCIAQIQINHFNHFVVIYKVAGAITLMDPSRGKVILDQEAFFKAFTGYIMELIPQGKVIQMRKQNHFLKLLKRLLKANYKMIIALLALSIPLMALTLLSGLNLILIFQYQMFWGAALIILLNILLGYIKNLIVSLLNQKINIALISNYLNHIYNLPLKYLQLKKVGELTNKLGDLYNLKDLFSKTLIDSILNFLLLGGIITVLWLVNPDLTLIVMVISSLYFLLSYFLNKKLYLKIIKIMQLENNFMDRLIEHLKKIKTIKNLRVTYFFNQTAQDLKLALNSKYYLDKSQILIKALTAFCEEGIFLSIIIYYFYTSGEYLTMMLYFTIYHYYLNTLKYYLELIPVTMYFKGVFRQITGIFALNKERDRMVIKKKPGSIKIKNLSYCYNPLNEIFKELNIEIRLGEKVLIKGPNGSGKSTLLDIIAANITDYDGIVKVGGKVNYLPQGASLFNGTIQDNIILEKKFDGEKYNLVTKITGLQELINNKNADFNLNINSFNLSGGERQRIILARTLYRDFDILILDEALSEINSEQRKAILDQIWDYYEAKTIIQVSHHQDEVLYHQIINLTVRKEFDVN